MLEPGQGDHSSLPNIGKRSPCRDYPLTASRFDQAGPDRAAGEVQTIAQAELVQHVCPVPFDRLDADEQHLCDLLGGVSLRDELEYLFLADSENLLRHALTTPSSVQVLGFERA
jgi:hypothetical protein